jgi:hypothetical protein
MAEEVSDKYTVAHQLGNFPPSKTRDLALLVVK